MRKHLTILSGILLAAVTGIATAADTTVRILHIQDNPKFAELWKEIGAEFEKQNPGVKIDWQFLENEAFKAKLPTTLQSKDRPDLFYSWAGGVFYDQARAGVLKDITKAMEGEWAASLSPAGVKAFTYDGKVYGAPMKTSLEILWYNKELLKKAGVDPASLATWNGFLEAVKKCKAAGITPLATGGGDKWPLHFYWTMLALRIGGKEAFEAAFNRTGEGFDSPTFVKAGEMFKELIDLQPFQPGFLRAKYPDAAGYFGDGKAAMFFMGDFLYAGQKTNSQSGKGVARRSARLRSLPGSRRRQGQRSRPRGGRRLAGGEGCARPGRHVPALLFEQGKPDQDGCCGRPHPPDLGCGGWLAEPVLSPGCGGL